MMDAFVDSSRETTADPATLSAITEVSAATRRSAGRFIAAHIAGHLSLGALTLWQLHEAQVFLYALFMEMVLAQANLLILNCVLSTTSLPRRIASTTGGLACISILPLLAVHSTDGGWGDFGAALVLAIIGLAAIVSSIALLLGLIFLRIMRQAPRIVPCTAARPVATNRWQFSIRQLLWLTTLTGVTVGLLKWTLRDPNSEFVPTVVPGLIAAFGVVVTLGIATYIRTPFARGALTLVLTPIIWLPLIFDLSALVSAPYLHSFVVLGSLTTLPWRGYRLIAPRGHDASTTKTAANTTSTSDRSD